MKFTVAFAALVAVAVASPLHKPIDASLVELEAIVAAINSPSTDPATAVLLEQQLANLIGAHLPAPVVDPAPIAIGPTLIDFPLPDGGAVTAVPTPVVEPSPAAVAPAAPAAESSPLVQVIVNIKSANSGAVVGAPAAVPSPAAAADPVQVVDEAVNPPSVVPSPVLVVEHPSVAVAAPEPVVIAPEPIQIGAPIVPQPIVLLPDILN